MLSHRWFLPVFFALVLASAVEGEEPKPDVLVVRLWTTTDTVLEHHVNAPTRQEMLLAAVRSMAARSGKGIPARLAQRLSKVANQDQLSELLAELKLTAGDTESVNMTLAAMASRIPGRPNVMPPDYLKVAAQLADNRYVGTGIQIRVDQNEKLTQIVVPFPGGPARRAGAKPMDLILSVDGEDMKGKTIQQVVDKLRGEEGTKVSVVVRQPEEKETRTLDMVRSVVPFQSALGCKRLGEESWDFRPDPSEPIGYIRLMNMTASTPSELALLEKRLKDEKAKALVLDLRTANGTQFQPLLLLADALLDGGVIWKSYDAQHKVKEHKADRDCLFRDTPIAVLVDEETDSFPVLLAAALQDRGRAVVVGATPISSGWITSLVPLPNNQGAMMVRTGMVARTKAPPDGPIPLSEDGGWQLYPDHEVTLNKKQRQTIFDWHIEQERTLEDKGGQMPDDPQLKEAMAVLKKAIKNAESKEPR